MANTFQTLPVPVTDGLGAAVLVSGVEPDKIFLVEGALATGIVVIEGSQDGVNFVPLFTFDFLADPKPANVKFVISHVRVRRANVISGGGPLVVTMGGENRTGNLFGNPAVPALNGIGAALDVSAHGPDKTIIVAGVFSGEIVVEGSMDGTNYTPVVFTTGPVAAPVTGAYQNLRVKRRIVDETAPGTPIVSVGSSSITGTSVVQTPLTFATVALTSAFNTTGLPNGTRAIIASLNRSFTFQAASSATVDPTNYDVIAATPSGRWFDTGEANEIYLQRTAWVINPGSGSNENEGSSALPLKTAKELDKRLHGLIYRNGATVTINYQGVTSPADTDLLNIRFGGYSNLQTETLQITGVRTVVASGTVTAVTPQDSTTNTPSQVTLSANVDTQLGEYIRFFSAGPTFRTSTFPVAALGGNSYRLMSPVDENGAAPTNITEPQIGDTFEVYNFTNIPDINIETSWASGVQGFNIDIENVGGGGFAHFLGNAFLTLFGSMVRGQTYDQFTSLQLENSWIRPPAAASGSFVFDAGGIYDDVGTNTTARIGSNRSKTALVFNRFNPMIHGCGLVLNGVESISNSTNAPCFFATPLATPCINLQGGCTWETGIVWGAPTATTFLKIDSANQSIAFSSPPTLSTAVNISFTVDGVNALVADLAVNSIADQQGNQILVESLGNPAPQPRVKSTGASSIAVANLVRLSGLTVVTARANTAANAASVMGVTSHTAASGSPVFVQNGDFVWIDFDAAPTVNAIAYLSVTTAGRATTTIPPLAATNQKLRLGHVVSVSGTLGLVAWKPEVLAVLADGLA